MKTMKRFLAAAMAVTSVMAIAPMSAFAENETGGTTNVKFNAVIEPAYTITIPATVDLNSTERKAEIKAEGVYLNTDQHKQINVTLNEASHTESGTTFHAQNTAGDSTVTYTINNGTKDIAVGDVVATFTNNPDETASPDVQTATLTFSEPTGATYAGTHTETLTFGISVEDAAPANPYAANSVGDVVTFGSYNWYIIGKSDNGVTLLMEKSFTDKAYNDSYEEVTWENCSLRTYLNGDFYNSFSDEDKAKIAKTTNTNPDNGSVSGGNATEDYIYLLSIAEANALDDINSSIRANGDWWWLRSPGYYSHGAAVVDADGVVFADGIDVDVGLGVRPALNLKF